MGAGDMKHAHKPGTNQAQGLGHMQSQPSITKVRELLLTAKPQMQRSFCLHITTSNHAQLLQRYLHHCTNEPHTKLPAVAVSWPTSPPLPLSKNRPMKTLNIILYRVTRLDRLWLQSARGPLQVHHEAQRATWGVQMIPFRNTFTP